MGDNIIRDDRGEARHLNDVASAWIDGTDVTCRFLALAAARTDGMRINAAQLLPYIPERRAGRELELRFRDGTHLRLADGAAFPRLRQRCCVVVRGAAQVPVFLTDQPQSPPTPPERAAAPAQSSRLTRRHWLAWQAVQREIAASNTPADQRQLYRWIRENDPEYDPPPLLTFLRYLRECRRRFTPTHPTPPTEPKRSRTGRSLVRPNDL